VDTRGAAGRLILNVFAAFAQFELEIMKERQREGIADAVRLFKEGKRVSEVAKELRIGRASVYRAIEHAGLRA
jgi:DNA invertase Pin-like site-specific DNA recombinase